MQFLVVDDHDLVCETIAAFLDHEGLGGVDTAPGLEDALEKLAATGGYDLVLLDYDMPGMNGLAGLTRVQSANNGRPVALISGTASPEVARMALEAGAAGFIPKTMPSQGMASAVRMMAAGEVFAPYAFLRQEGATGTPELTTREREVLRGLCAGLSNKEIARELGLQEVTAKLHVRTLSRKLGARNRTHAATIAKDLKLG